MILTSIAFENGAPIPMEYTCDDKKISPPLSITEVPEKTKSLALILDDPDAPNRAYDHWLLWNIDPGTIEILKGKKPVGSIIGENSAGKASYFPPCPSNGAHRYFFKLYALDKKLDLSQGTRRSELQKAMDGHIIDRAELMGMHAH